MALLLDDLSVHGSIGKSLREANRGGPDIRAYVGLKWGVRCSLEIASGLDSNVAEFDEASMRLDSDIS